VDVTRTPLAHVPDSLPEGKHLSIRRLAGTVDQGLDVVAFQDLNLTREGARNGVLLELLGG
jgi:hypothetical protein